MNVLKKIEDEQLKKHPEFRPGDTLRVHVKIKEGDKERIQVFEGVVIAQRHGGARESFTVRKMSYGVGVERVFPLHSPAVDKIEIVSSGKVRRSKLYYLRNLQGKKARLKSRDRWKSKAEIAAEKEAAAKASRAASAPVESEPSGDVSPESSAATEAPVESSEQPLAE